MNNDLVGSTLLLCATALYITRQIILGHSHLMETTEALGGWATAAVLVACYFIAWPRLKPKSE
jgi:hypothetical protein